MKTTSSLSPPTASFWKANKSKVIILCVSLGFIAICISALLFWEKEITNVNEHLTYTGATEQIPVTSAYVDQCSACDLKNHVEDVNMGAAQGFYWCSKTDHDWDQGLAIINFPWSLVESIYISTYRNQSVTDGLQPIVFDPIAVDICDQKSDCAVCNLMFPQVRASSGTIKCVGSEMEGTEGNQIRILHPGKPIKICAVKIYGKIFTEVAVREIEPYSADADNSRSINGMENSIENSIDSIEVTEEENCFISSKEVGGWATIQIPWSMVPHLEVLTIDSEASDTVEGMYVFVCQIGPETSCHPCGVARETRAASWTTIHCTGGMIEGDLVKFVHSYRRLQFCDVKIYGLQFAPGAGVVSHLEAFVTATAFDTEREVFNYQPILGATQTEQDTEILGLGYSYPRFCPVSDLVGENWAVVDLENYVIVHRVTFLRDQSTNFDLMGITVDVCETQSSGCQRCAAVGNTSLPGEHEVVYCTQNPKPRGRILMIRKHDGPIHFCETHVFGEILESDYSFREQMQTTPSPNFEKPIPSFPPLEFPPF